MTPSLRPDMGRRELANLLAARGYRRGAEIGVGAGHYAEWLLQANPALELYCVDPWQAYADFTQQQLTAFCGEAIERLLPYGDRVEIWAMRSTEAAEGVEDDGLDFVYIDGAHDEASVRDDLEAWVPKVRSGGVVAGHDYAKLPVTPCGVIPAVKAYVKAHGLRLVVLRGTDKRPSWAWDQP